MKTDVRFQVCILAVLLLPGWALGQSATLTVVPRSPTVQQGGQVTVDVFISNLPEALRGYQVTIAVTPVFGATGTLTPVAAPNNVQVDTTRADWVFTVIPPGATAFVTVNTTTLAAAGTLTSGFGAGPFPDAKYLAHYVLQASPTATGSFNLSLTAEAPPAGTGATFLRDTSIPSQPIPRTIVNGVVAAVTPAPNNDNCANSIPIADGNTAFSTTSTTTDGPVLPGSCDEGGGNTFENDVWFNYTASCTGTASISTCNGATFNTRIAVYGGLGASCTCPGAIATPVTCDDDAPGCGNTAEAVFSVVQGRCYTIRLGSALAGGTGSGTISIACLDNDTCNTARTVTASSTTFGTTRNSATDSGLPSCGPFGTSTASGGVWYKVTSPSTAALMTASLCGQTPFNSRLSIFSGATCSGLACVDAADNNCVSPDNTNETVSWCATPSTVYWILVHGGAGASGTFRLVVSNAACNDGNACTTNACTAGACVFTNTTPAGQCCDPTNGALMVIDDSNPCTTDACPASGLPTHTPVPNGENAVCDDDLRCTLDACTNGNCTNTDINTITCTVSANCPGLGNTCQANICRCIEDPTLDLVADPGSLSVNGCYDTGETVTVRVLMGFSPDPIVAAQFFLEYDAASLQFVNLRPGSVVDASSPFSFELQETVSPANGTIDYAVAVPPGQQGTALPATVAVMTFQAIDECDPYIRFRAHDPPTQLLDATAETFTPLTTNLEDLHVNGTPPILSGCPADMATGFDASSFTATVAYPPPTADDSCDGALPVTCVPPPSSAFGAGTTPVVCTATNSCGVSASCGFDVTVTPSTLTVDVQLSPTVASSSRQRCITFEVWDCTDSSHESVDQTISFSSGVANNVVVNVPGGSWNCVTARDKLHTLRSTATDMATADSIDYSASFTGDQDSGGHWLVGGNLNDDPFVDVQDYVRFLANYLGTPLPNTPCGTLPYHADVNQSGVVDVADLSFIQIAMFSSHEANCCGSVAATDDGGSSASVSLTEGEPFGAVSIKDLRRVGLGHLIAGDLNQDDLLDIDDVDLFIERAAKQKRGKNNEGIPTRRLLDVPVDSGDQRSGDAVNRK